MGPSGPLSQEPKEIHFFVSLAFTECSSVPLGCAQTWFVITHGILGALACIITGEDKHPAGGRTQFSLTQLWSWFTTPRPAGHCVALIKRDVTELIFPNRKYE